jgi:hypothetical protein
MADGLTFTASESGLTPESAKITNAKFTSLVSSTAAVDNFQLAITRDVLLRLGFPQALEQISVLLQLYSKTGSKRDSVANANLVLAQNDIVANKELLISLINDEVNGTGSAVGSTSIATRMASFSFNPAQEQLKVVQNVVGRITSRLESRKHIYQIIRLLNKDYAVKLPGVVGALIGGGGGGVGNKRRRRS